MSRLKLAEGSYSSVLCPESAYIRAAHSYLALGQEADRLMSAIDANRSTPEQDEELEELDDDDSVVVALRDCATAKHRLPTENAK